MHILKYTEWKAGSGRWYCNDITNLCGSSSLWWTPARMLDLAPADYVKWLVDNYSPDRISFNGKTLIYSWDEEHYAKCHKLILDLNRIARNKNFTC